MRYWVILALAALSFARPCDAGMILSNSPGNDLASYAPINSNLAYSIGFTVGDTSVVVDSIELRLQASANPGTATVEIRESVGVSPSSSSLVTFSSQAIAPSSFANYTFDANSTVTLAANTTYWLTILNNFSAPNGLVIAASNPASTPSGPAAVFAGLRFGTVTDQLINVLTSPPPTFQINGSINAVPEPTTLGCFAIACVALQCRLNRRRETLSRESSMKIS